MKSIHLHCATLQLGRVVSLGPALLWWPELRWHCAEEGAFRDGSALSLCDGASYVIRYKL